MNGTNDAPDYALYCENNGPDLDEVPCSRFAEEKFVDDYRQQESIEERKDN